MVDVGMHMCYCQLGCHNCWRMRTAHGKGLHNTFYASIRIGASDVPHQANRGMPGVLSHMC